MSKVKVMSIAVSIDGYMAGPDQSETQPLGVGGAALHAWCDDTRTFREQHGQAGGRSGIDDDYVARGFANVGAWIIGRNMFGPLRGPWSDDRWQGWWGPAPPFHVPVFVLTQYPRPALEMVGGTRFEFVSDGTAAALERAKLAAGERDVRIGGGAQTIRQYLRAGQVDELHLVQVPTVLGSGEPLPGDANLLGAGLTLRERVSGEGVTHIVLGR